MPFSSTKKRFATQYQTIQISPHPKKPGSKNCRGFCNALMFATGDTNTYALVKGVLSSSFIVFPTEFYSVGAQTPRRLRQKTGGAQSRPFWLNV